MIERTLIMIKPDGVQRCLIGEIITRFEKAGLKIIGLKMVWPTKEQALKHYTEDIAIRRGQKVRDLNVEFITSGPVVVAVIEGSSAVENVRKMCGYTEPKSSLPGTIRGDYAHVSYAYSDSKSIVVKNVIHASSDANDAKREIGLWFSPDELHTYKTVHDIHVI